MLRHGVVLPATFFVAALERRIMKKVELDSVFAVP